MKKILARLPHPLFLTLLASNIVYFLSLLFFAQAKVRSAGVLLVVILCLVGLSGLSHFFPPIPPEVWPQLTSTPQKVWLTKPQLEHAVKLWQDVYAKQPQSEMVALTLLSLCQANGQTECVNQTQETLKYLNPAILSQNR